MPVASPPLADSRRWGKVKHYIQASSVCGAILQRRSPRMDMLFYTAFLPYPSTLIYGGCAVCSASYSPPPLEVARLSESIVYQSSSNGHSRISAIAAPKILSSHHIFGPLGIIR